MKSPVDTVKIPAQVCRCTHLETVLAGEHLACGTPPTPLEDSASFQIPLALYAQGPVCLAILSTPRLQRREEGGLTWGWSTQTDAARGNSAHI